MAKFGRARSTSKHEPDEPSQRRVSEARNDTNNPSQFPAQSTTIRSRNHPKKKTAAAQDRTPPRALPPRNGSKLNRSKYTRLKFHVDQTISQYPSTIYKSFDKDPQPARPQWVSPAFGPNVTLHHVREAIIKPDRLPAFMVTPIDRFSTKLDLKHSEKGEDSTFPRLHLTSSTRPFPREPLTSTSPQNAGHDPNQRQRRNRIPIEPLILPSRRNMKKTESRSSGRPKSKIPLDRFLETDKQRQSRPETSNPPVLVNDMFGPDLVSPTAIEPLPQTDHPPVSASDIPGQAQPSRVYQGIGRFMSTLLDHQSNIQIKSKKENPPRPQKVDRRKRREEQAARMAQSLRKTGRSGKESGAETNSGSVQPFGRTCLGQTSVVTENPGDDPVKDTNAVIRRQSDDRSAQQQEPTISVQGPPSTLHAYATANHLQEAYPLDGTPVTSSPLPALSSAIPLLLPATAAQIRSQPRPARKRRILQMDESEETVSPPTAQPRKHTPLAQMKSLSINAPCPGFTSTTFQFTPSSLRNSVTAINDPIESSPTKADTAGVMLARTPNPNTALKRTRTLGIDLRRNVGVAPTPFKVPTQK